MKKKIIFIMMFAITLFIAVSCSNKKYKTYDKELNIVSLRNYSKANDKATDLKDITFDGKLRLKFIEGEDYIPYIDIESYFTLIPEDLAKTCKYADTDDEVDLIFEYKDKKATIRIFTKLEQVVFENQLAYIYENEDTDSTSLRTKFSYKFDTKNMKNHVINYKEYGFKSFRENGKTYLPLSFIDPIVNEAHVTNIFYNYDKLFIYSDPEALTDFKYIDNGKETTVMHDMKNKITENILPEYLRLFNKNYLYFIFDNFYGLNTQKGITKMSTYFESLDYSKMLLSENPEERGDALALMLSTLEDSHTVLISTSIAWDEDNYKTLPQSMTNDRAILKKNLSDERAKVYKSLGLDLNGVRYSSDGKTAVITLDEFECDSYPYLENKKIKSDEELAETDNYFKILNNLREIDKKGGVTKVIIDMSVNSGGNSAVMTKIINLLSKTNNASITLHDSNTNVNQTMSSQIDSNNDGKYDDNDVYGNKYKFFILTSPVAFSCGTAMPFFVSHQEIGYIIGQTQGGGECALSQIVLPNGQIIGHSSSLHVFTYEGDKMVGDEAGATPDLPFSYFDFYDIEKLAGKINEYEKLFK